jgi:hypothetical protein
VPAHVLKCWFDTEAPAARKVHAEGMLNLGLVYARSANPK